LSRLRLTLKKNGQFGKLRSLDDMIESSWQLYRNRPYLDAKSVLEKLSSVPSDDRQIPFGLELVRQIVEINRDGALTNDIFYRKVIGRLTVWLRQALTALRMAWLKVKSGDVEATLLREAVEETERVLAALEAQYPDTRNLLDDHLRKRR
jgi:hypothetical protein